MKPLAEAPWRLLADRVAARLGLDFGAAREADLRRGMRGAARELGLADEAACARRLLSKPQLDEVDVQLLARHLTVGETYFFRDEAGTQALRDEVLPALVAARRDERRLRVWSAACCSGEEAYTLAILLHEAMPDIADWDVQVLATDINAAAVRKGREGCYGEWSFRGAPADLRARWFEATDDGRQRVRPGLRRLVRFSELNLVDLPSSLAAGRPWDIDLVVCRNVLMYLTPEHGARVVAALRRCMRPDGWLALGAAEGWLATSGDFAPVTVGGASFLRCAGEAARPAPARVAAPVLAPLPRPPRAVLPPPLPPPPPVEAPVPTVASCAEQARACADTGRLVEALAWCEAWLALDKLDPAAHYLRAAVLLERREFAAARRALQHALYLDDGFVLAHFALGHLAAADGQGREASRHFVNARRALSRYDDDQPVPEGHGLRAGELGRALGLQRGGWLS